jgi:hypothetical protein
LKPTAAHTYYKRLLKPITHIIDKKVDLADEKKKPTAALLFLNIQSPFLHHVVATGGGARSGVGPLHHPFPDL